MDEFDFQYQHPEIRGAGVVLNKDEQGNVISAESGLTNAPEADQTSENGSILPIEINAPEPIIEAVQGILEGAGHIAGKGAEGVLDVAKDISYPVRATGAALEAAIEASQGADFNESFQDKLEYGDQAADVFKSFVPETENPVVGVAGKLAEISSAAATLPIGEAKALQGLIKYGLANVLSVEADEENLANLVEDLDFLPEAIQNAAGLMSVDEDDSEIEATLKHAIEEGLLFGGGKLTADMTAGMAKLLKSSMGKAAKIAGKKLPKEALQSDSQILDTLAQPAHGKIAEANRGFKPKKLTEGQKARVDKNTDLDTKFINLANLDTDNRVKARIAQSSKEMMKYLKKRGLGQRMTRKKLLNSARHYTNKKNFHKYEKQFIEKGIGDISDPNIQGKMMALRQMMVTRGEQIVKIKEAIVKNGETDELLAALKKAEDAEDALLQVDKAISTNLGRGLSFRGVLAKARKEGIPEEEVLAVYKATDGDMAAVEDFVHRSVAGDAVDVFTEFTINNMFSVATMTLNALTAAVNTVVNPALRVVGGAIGSDRDEVLKGMATYQGIMSNAWMSLKMGTKSLFREEAILDSGGQAFKLHSNKAISTDRFQSLKNTKRGYIVDALGNIIRFPSRVLNGTDEFSKQIGYRSFIYSEGWYEGMKKGLKGKELSNYITQKINQSIGKNGEALDPKALDYARMNTFTRDFDPSKSIVGAFGEAVSSISNSRNPVIRAIGKHIFPFVKVPFNILDQSIDLTPGLNLLRRRTWDDLKGVNGPTAKALRYGRIATSASIAAVAYDLEKKGVLTGSEKRNYTQQENLKGLSHPPNSIKIGNEWHPLERFEPYSTPLLFMANLSNMSDQLSERELSEGVASFAILMEESIQSKRYLQNLTDLIDLATEEDEERVKTKYDRFMRKKAMLAIPGVVRFTNNDPYYREVYNLQQAMMNRLGMGDGSETRNPIDPKRNMFGEARLKNRFFDYDEFNDSMSVESATNAAFDYFGTQEATESPLEKELARLITDSDARFPLQERTHGNLDLTSYRDPQTGQSALDRMRELLGEVTDPQTGSPYQGMTLRSAMNKLMKSKEYREAADAVVDDPELGTLQKGTKRELMQNLLSKYRLLARAVVLGTQDNIFNIKGKDFKSSPNGEGMNFLSESGVPIAQAVAFDLGNKENISTPISQVTQNTPPLIGLE